MTPVPELSNRPGSAEPSDWNPRFERFNDALGNLLVLSVIFLFIITVICITVGLAVRDMNTDAFYQAFFVMFIMTTGTMLFCGVAWVCGACAQCLRKRWVM